MVTGSATESGGGGHVEFNCSGNPINSTAPLSGFEFGLNGMRYDPNTSDYVTETVPYDPSTGQHEPDPLGFASGTTNFYAWAGNNAVENEDPSGECSTVYTLGDALSGTASDIGPAVSSGMGDDNSLSYNDIASSEQEYRQSQGTSSIWPLGEPSPKVAEPFSFYDSQPAWDQHVAQVAVSQQQVSQQPLFEGVPVTDPTPFTNTSNAINAYATSLTPDQLHIAQSSGFMRRLDDFYGDYFSYRNMQVSESDYVDFQKWSAQSPVRLAAEQALADGDLAAGNREITEAVRDNPVLDFLGFGWVTSWQRGNFASENGYGQADDYYYQAKTGAATFVMLSAATEVGGQFWGRHYSRRDGGAQEAGAAIGNEVRLVRRLKRDSPQTWFRLARLGAITGRQGHLPLFKVHC